MNMDEDDKPLLSIEALAETRISKSMQPDQATHLSVGDQVIVDDGSAGALTSVRKSCESQEKICLELQRRMAAAKAKERKKKEHGKAARKSSSQQQQQRGKWERKRRAWKSSSKSNGDRPV